MQHKVNKFITLPATELNLIAKSMTVLLKPRILIKRSIHNLIVNAYKHNPIGTKVLIQVSMRENDVYVVVADTGTEIPQSIERSIFEPFVCGDESRTSGNGNGLGLAISQIIARKHGGDLYVSKNIDGYTKGFVMKLPVKMDRKKKIW